jgi:hypothetical protein
MTRPPVNPLYKKKPGETAREHMVRLRAEFPGKFGMQPGQKINPANKGKYKKFTAADVAAAEKRGAEKARAAAEEQFKTFEEKKGAKPAATGKVSEVPMAPSGERPGAGSLDSTSAAPAPAPLDIPMSNPPPQIVDEHEIFSPPPPPDPNAPAVGPELTGPPPPQPAPGPAGEPKGDGGKYGTMIWAIIVKMFVGIFGPGFEPIIVKDSTGQILYDENAEGLKVWVNYLASIGIKTFSPVVELWIFMGSYVGLRAGLIIAKFKGRKKAAQQSAPPTEPTAGSPTQKSAPSPGKPAPQTPPAPQPQPPSPAAQQPAIGEVETGEIEI